ncbi:cupin domain-containing protein [Aliamphritea hakodatensis]|uniref:cupin domain-containing protein n=1 Tax=Aliamphritea hakodatensis TaxID=2895352 RepID=UPI0022FD578A|nr:cupin domain-containing protein [Aliamphritea hakodatensis]
MPTPTLFKFSDIENRLVELEPGGTYIKPWVNTKVSESMAGGVNFLNNVSVPWNLEVDEIIFVKEGNFRLIADGEPYQCAPGDVLYMPKGMDVKYECDEKCVIFYAVYPVDWKQQLGITEVPGIDPEDM